MITNLIAIEIVVVAVLSIQNPKLHSYDPCNQKPARRASIPTGKQEGYDSSSSFPNVKYFYSVRTKTASASSEISI